MDTNVDDQQQYADGDEYRSLFEHAIEGMYRTTPDGGFLRANTALARIYGYTTPEDLIADLTDIARQVYVEVADRDRFKQTITKDGEIRDFEARVYRKDGSIIWITENARAVRDERGKTLYYEGTVEDITARRNAEDQLKLAGAVFSSAAEGIVICNCDSVVLATNPAFSSITGWQPDQVVGRFNPLIADELSDEASLREIAAAGDAGRPWSGELWAKRADGSAFPASLSVSTVKSAAGECQARIFLFADISQRIAYERQIHYQARYDSLTRLVNRNTATRFLEQAMHEVLATGLRLALLFLDVDRFKDVNDSLGHSAGDELLQQLARRLSSCVRVSDIVGRLGGDEFVVVLPALSSMEAIEACVEKLLYAFSEPFTVSEQILHVSCSIGIAVYPEDAATVDALMSHADMAMYDAKTSGGGWSYYNGDMKTQYAARVTIANELRHGLDQQRFRLAYQPKVDCSNGAIVGAEALIRCRTASGVELSPSQFIPIAERTGLIGAIGDWVLYETCGQIRRWRDAGIVVPPVSINISASQFRDTVLTKKIAAAVAAAGLQPSALEVEITESVMADDGARAVEILSELNAMGIRIAIDDFGTGYSSFAYLKRFPIDTLKIDRAFINGLPEDGKDGAIVTSLIGLGAHLGFDVLAEGVETVQQRDFLAERGCRLIQGFFYDRPLEVPDFVSRLQGGRG
ncbi:MAG TPA: EAL domain-containing protein [Magnetospirillaceae bacterium]|jgi:diguanylate cyclase (GGDEF)-like protein/PAS domain S-box-containing protein